MKTIIYSIFVIAWLLYLSDMTIKFKPFSISFNSPYLAFAWLFLVMAIVLFQIDSDKKAYKRGIDDCVNEITNVLNNKHEKNN